LSFRLAMTIAIRHPKATITAKIETKISITTPPY
jgi:hypothetical protein